MVLRIVSFVLMGLSASADSRPAAPEETRPARAVMAVCEFGSAGDRGRLGRRVAEALRMKLARYKDEFVLVERLDLNDALAGAGVAVRFDTDRKKLVALGKEVLDAHVLVWGKVERQGDGFTIRARALDLRRKPADLYVDGAFSANGFREIPFAVQRIVSAVRRDEAAPDPGFDPREPGSGKPDPEILARPNLLTGGDFEQGEKTPAGWEPVDGLVSFWVKAPDRPGKCIKFDTDVNDEQWRAWHKKFTLGTTDPPPGPIRGRGPKYETVGGIHGAWLYNAHYIPVKKGRTYRISFDFKGRMAGDMFFAKVFIKGYAPFPKGRREVWRSYKACRVKTQGRQWEHFTRTFNPTKSIPQVKWMKVELFTYWPPGLYYFDNVHLCEEARTKGMNVQHPTSNIQRSTTDGRSDASEKDEPKPRPLPRGHEGTRSGRRFRGNGTVATMAPEGSIVAPRR